MPGHLSTSPKRPVAPGAELFSGLDSDLPWYLPLRRDLSILTNWALPGALMALWIYAWPVVIAWLSICPATSKTKVAAIAGYFAIYTLCVLWAGSIKDIPASQFGAITLPARSSATPQASLLLWLVVNGVPSLLWWFCFNSWIRAVAPLLLSFTTVLVSGFLVAYLAQFSADGVDATIALALWFDVDVRVLVAVAMLGALLSFGLFGWLATRWIADRYRQKRLNDQSLQLDALWLLFATWYAMWLILGGLLWGLTALIAFGCFRGVLSVRDRYSPLPATNAPGLIFLRVFGLGRRSDRLFKTLTGYWRHIASVQMITGPDIARSTVQPHQFLDFISGKLANHFVLDQPSFEHRLASWDRYADPDGLYRINSFFCRTDTWQRVIQQLLQTDDLVLMDLRSFTPSNAGCQLELQYLIHHVTLKRWLLIVDHTTEHPYLKELISRQWTALAPDSPNYHRTPEQVRMIEYDYPGQLPQVIRQLCLGSV